MTKVTKPILLDETAQKISSALNTRNVLLNGLNENLMIYQNKKTHQVSSWKDVQDIVRAGLAPIYFNIGDDFSIDAIAGMIIIGFDKDIPSDKNYTHSMTLSMGSSDLICNGDMGTMKPWSYVYTCVINDNISLSSSDTYYIHVTSSSHIRKFNIDANDEGLGIKYIKYKMNNHTLDSIYVELELFDENHTYLKTITTNYVESVGDITVPFGVFTITDTTTINAVGAPYYHLWDGSYIRHWLNRTSSDSLTNEIIKGEFIVDDFGGDKSGKEFLSVVGSVDKMTSGILTSDKFFILSERETYITESDIQTYYSGEDIRYEYYKTERCHDFSDMIPPIVYRDQVKVVFSEDTNKYKSEANPRVRYNDTYIGTDIVYNQPYMSNITSFNAEYVGEDGKYPITPGSIYNLACCII